MSDLVIKTQWGHEVVSPPGRPLVLMLHGSHLYGTDTQDSDYDYKGVFLPTHEDILLGRIPKTVRTSTGSPIEKNNPGDVDVVWFSLHEFVRQACEGQTITIDMLYAPESMYVGCGYEWDHTWKMLQCDRARFRTKRMNAFLGYCQRQAAKYGIKGSRLAAARWVLQELETAVATWRVTIPKVSHLWAFKNIPEEHREFVKWKCVGDRTFLEVCGKKLEATAPVSGCIEPIARFVESYGERARQAERNEGIDWKAVSHALRAGYQLRQLYREGIITFPLDEADFLLDVKLGRLDYLTCVAPALEDLVEEVTCLSSSSGYPEKVDTDWWDEWIVQRIEPCLW